MSQWSLYIIRCRRGELYTGVSTDIPRRFAEHQAGGAKAAKYLRGRGPLQLVYQELVGDRGQALKREWQVKQLSREAKWQLVQSQQALGSLPEC